MDRDQVEELQGTIKDLGSRTRVSVWCSVELCACGVVGAGRLHEDDPVSCIDTRPVFLKCH